MSRIIVLMILANRLLIVFISTSAKIGGPSSFLLPVAETVFDIGDEADQRDAEKSQKHDGDEGHLQGISFEVDEVAETFGGHEKLSDDDVDDGAADAGAQSGENVGDGRRQSDGKKHLEICRGKTPADSKIIFVDLTRALDGVNDQWKYGGPKERPIMTMRQSVARKIPSQKIHLNLGKTSLDMSSSVRLTSFIGTPPKLTMLMT